MLRVTLVDIIPHTTSVREREQRMMELEKLSLYLWMTSDHQDYPKKDTPAYRTYIGQGKLDTIVEEMIEEKSDLLIV
jgi:50S ribosomal subunit-associated GTPase HflX